MHCGLGSVTLSQQAFPGGKRPSFQREKSQWGTKTLLKKPTLTVVSHGVGEVPQGAECIVVVCVRAGQSGHEALCRLQKVKADG